MQSVPIGKIKPNPKNPRTIRDERFEKLKKSLQDFPDMLNKRPLVCFTDKDGKFVVLGGNMRLKAAKDIGMKELPVVLADEWTEEQKERFKISDNVGFGDWNMEELKADWDAEKLDEWGLEVDWKDEVELEAVEDDFDGELPEEPITVLGDLYEIGEHRLLCGDSTDSEQVARLMNGEKADMVFTSPPYNQGNGGMKYDYKGDVKKLYQEKTDLKTPKEYFDFCINILNNVSTNTKENAAVFWNVMYNAKSRSDYGEIVFSVQNPFKIYETIIWDKTHSFPTASKGILSRRAELVFLMSKEKYYTNQGENEPIDNFWVVSTNGAQHDIHKACFPIGLPDKGIKLCSKEDEIIYDPFLGSGSTMVAAHQLKRRCFGCELDPKYCDVIVNRMLKLDPTLEVKLNGKPFVINS